MPVANAEIARELDRIADLLDIEGANPFRVRAYRRAARIVETLPRGVSEMLAAGEDLDDLPGIGKDLAEKIGSIAHPTGRLLTKRPSYDLDFARLLRAARERGCHFEVNAQPDRLDLPDTVCRLAKEAGVRLAISTDAHSTDELAFMGYGVDVARRGWLEPDDILNTRPWPELKALLRRR